MSSSSTSPIVAKTDAFVTDLFARELPAWAVYHSIDHVHQVFRSAREIGQASGLSRVDQEIVEIAALLHDAGFTQGADGHEERSVAIAADFLTTEGYPAERILAVQGCIRSTTIPQRPQNRLEEVVCDADVLHLGKKRFFDRSALLRAELELSTGKTFGEEEWIKFNIDFVTRHTFHTPYGREAFADRRAKNLVRLQEQFRDIELRSRSKTERADQKKDKESIPERGIETMFRVVPKNHLDLTALADHKASIMISTNSLVISIVVGLLLSKLDTHPHLIVPTLLLLAVCSTALTFAILATRPQVTSGTFTREDIEQKKTNLLFFGNFFRSSVEDFEWGMKRLMNDRDYLYGSMIRDLHSLGKVLGRKYHYLRISYTIFMYGLIATVIAFAIAMLATPPPVP